MSKSSSGGFRRSRTSQKEHLAAKADSTPTEGFLMLFALETFTGWLVARCLELAPKPVRFGKKLVLCRGTVLANCPFIANAVEQGGAGFL